MIGTQEELETLIEMRNAQGLTQEEVGQLLGDALGRPAYTHARIHQIETEGTKDADQIEALAAIYDRPLPHVSAAAKRLRN